jgi:hypothetical protein
MGQSLHAQREARWSRRLSPLNAATDTGLLARLDWTAVQYRINCGAQIATGQRLSISGTTVISLASVSESALVIEEKEIRCAHRRISSGYILALVVAQRESEAEL